VPLPGDVGVLFCEASSYFDSLHLPELLVRVLLIKYHI
jgi:hypothetical protein